MVIDGVSNRVVDGAMVTLTIGPASQQDLTTSFGSYSFLVKGANPSVVARVSVAANGYRNVSDQAVAGDWGVRESVLIPVHIAGSASAGGGGILRRRVRLPPIENHYDGSIGRGLFDRRPQKY